MRVVLDTSALLAALWAEPGADDVDSVISEACISAVSLAELVAKLTDRGASEPHVDALLASIGAEVIDFDAAQGRMAGLLRRETRALGLSLGDRCCLALAIQTGADVLTADRAWSGLSLGVNIRVIR